mgnify:CR=1 FL=1
MFLLLYLWKSICSNHIEKRSFYNLIIEWLDFTNVVINYFHRLTKIIIFRFGMGFKKNILEDEIFSDNLYVVQMRQGSWNLVEDNNDFIHMWKVYYKSQNS